MGRSDLHDSGGHPNHRLDGAISDEVRRWLRVDEVGRITRAKGVTSTSAIPSAGRSGVRCCFAEPRSWRLPPTGRKPSLTAPSPLGSAGFTSPGPGRWWTRLGRAGGRPVDCLGPVRPRRRVGAAREHLGCLL